MKYRKKPAVIEAEQWFPGLTVEGVEEVAAEIIYSRDERLFYIQNGKDHSTAWISVAKNDEGKHEVLPFAFYDVKSGKREPLKSADHPLFGLYVDAMRCDDSPFKMGDWDGSLKAFGRVNTLEGVMIADPGDFIITGVKGEKYLVKPDIFEATYEPVNDDE